jgi:molybdenum cofactor biosynthesis enzyme MoaA
MAPSYLRVVVTSRCSLACRYCHGEGYDSAACGRSPLTVKELLALIHRGVDEGIRKIKILGGEPLLYPDLPVLISDLSRNPRLEDLSLITAGAVPTTLLDQAFEAGLPRANLTIHGWSLSEFERRTGRGRRHWEQRTRMLQRLLEYGRPIKLNVVYSGPQDEADIAALLDEVADMPLLVNILDDLGVDDLGPGALIGLVHRLRGEPCLVHEDRDPHSLPTLHLGWRDGLRVEIKHQQLGRIAPWEACASCPSRARCKEGIHALRLSSDGTLRTCMDRPDLSWPLAEALRTQGLGAVTEHWRSLLTIPRKEVA